MNHTADQVDELLGAIGLGTDVETPTAHLRRLGAAAVPRLLEHLESGEDDRRRLALYGLQFCWCAEALRPVVELLAFPELEIRRMTAIVIDRHYSRAEVARQCRRFMDHPDPAVAGFCYEHNEFMFPSVASIKDALRTPGKQHRACKYLARYHTRRLSPVTRTLLDHEDEARVRAAIIGLLNQCDVTRRTRRRLEAMLGHESAICRDAAAEYFAWHGRGADLAALRAALQSESDPHAGASLGDAIACIERREACTDAPSRPQWQVDPEDKAGARYYRALEAMAAGAMTRDEAFTAYRKAEPYEPRWFYQGGKPDQAFNDGRHTRYELQARLFGFPWCVSRCRHRFDGPLQVGAARTLMAPVTGYFDRDGDNFGLHTEKTNRAFKSLVHVGEDIAWHRDHLTVVAIADGVVRRVIREPSWGHLLIIEHHAPVELLGIAVTEVQRFARIIEAPVERPTGSVVFCSLYAHLGPFIRVRAGERVRCGQKIATLGRSLTYENGGYPAHLHFGLHLGPYVQPPRPGAPVDVNFQGVRYRARAVRADAEQTHAEIRYQGDPRYHVVKLTRWEAGYIARWFWHTREHGWLHPMRVLGAASGRKEGGSGKKLNRVPGRV